MYFMCLEYFFLQRKGQQNRLKIIFPLLVCKFLFYISPTKFSFAHLNGKYTVLLKKVILRREITSSVCLRDFQDYLKFHLANFSSNLVRTGHIYICGLNTNK